mgnify:CR=1 FL=1
MSKKKQSPPVPRCALCKGFINILDNDYVVGSTGRMVCRGCLEMSFHILEASKETEKENVSAPSITPQYIVQEVNKAIIGQEQAKSAVALAVWKQMLRANGDNFVPRTNLLLYGPSGCGKTAIIREAARIAGLPFLAVDATGITETGYRGKNAADIVTDLLTGFKGHPHVRHAIIFIDEVDKLSAHGADWRQAYCQGTQHALLKLVEGMEVTVDGMTINSTDLLFLFGGAFGRMQEARKCVAPIGFVRSEPFCPSVTQHTAEDFCAYGMERELMGRIGRFVPVEQLTTEQMKRILTESSLSAFVKYKKFFRAHKVRLKLPDELVEQLACESVAQGTGARGLDGAVEALVQPLLYALAEGKLSGSVTLGGGIYGRVS